MGSHRNLDGTSRPDFSVGVEQEHGVRIIDGEVGLYDPINGEHRLSEMLSGGGTADFGKLLVTTEGGLLYDSQGNILLKKVAS